MNETRTFGRRNAPTLRGQTPRRHQRSDRAGLADNGGKLALDLLRNVALGALVVLGVSAVIAMRGNGTAPSTVAEIEKKPAKAEPCGATLAEFYKLQTGMSYDQVERIIGCDGEISSQVEIAGINTAMVTWKATDRFIGSMNATFQNGKLVARAQFGLK